MEFLIFLRCLETFGELHVTRFYAEYSDFNHQSHSLNSVLSVELKGIYIECPNCFQEWSVKNSVLIFHLRQSDYTSIQILEQTWLIFEYQKKNEKMNLKISFTNVQFCPFHFVIQCQKREAMHLSITTSCIPPVTATSWLIGAENSLSKI